jgi:branched-chain amino acid transport system substrate-binding protein
MRQIFRTTMLVALASSGLLASAAHGQERIRIGVLNDQSGVFSTYQGVSSVVAAQMAVEDYGGKAAGKSIRSRYGRPPEQDRCRRNHRAAVVRE